MKSETELAEARRRRQYRTTARVLREYTARLNRLADRLGNHLDGLVAKPPSGYVSWAVLGDIWRVAALHQKLLDLALTASQMLVHYDLGEAEKVELAIRLADMEHAITTTRSFSSAVAEQHHIEYPLRQSIPQSSAPKNETSPTDRKPARRG